MTYRVANSGVNSRVLLVGLPRGDWRSSLREWLHSDTLPSVRRSPVQFWFVICLLVVRLVLGEFAHAMPHQAEAPNTAVNSGEAAACPQHAHAADDRASQMDQQSQSEKPGQTKDCCKAGGCLCLHASAIVASSSVIASTSLDRSTAIICTLGLVQRRIDRLFRPPA